jgi:hypothetical protein
MDTFPTKGNGLSQGESPSLYDCTPIDETLKSGTDGGYEFRRRRTTRVPREIISTGFIGIPNDDYLVLRQFWRDHQLDVGFVYHDYIHGIDRQVRFDTWDPKYVGVGQNRMWNVTIKMSEI